MLNTYSRTIMDVTPRGWTIQADTVAVFLWARFVLPFNFLVLRQL